MFEKKEKNMKKEQKMFNIHRFHKILSINGMDLKRSVRILEFCNCAEQVEVDTVVEYFWPYRCVTAAWKSHNISRKLQGASAQYIRKLFTKLSNWHWLTLIETLIGINWHWLTLIETLIDINWHWLTLIKTLIDINWHWLTLIKTLIDID